LRKRLMEMRYDFNGSLSTFLTNFDGQVRKLKEAGVNLDEQDVIVSLLLAMPKNMEGVVTARSRYKNFKSLS